MCDGASGGCLVRSWMGSKPISECSLTGWHAGTGSFVAVRKERWPGGGRYSSTGNPLWRTAAMVLEPACSAKRMAPNPAADYGLLVAKESRIPTLEWVDVRAVGITWASAADTPSNADAKRPLP